MSPKLRVFAMNKLIVIFSLLSIALNAFSKDEADLIKPILIEQPALELSGALTRSSAKGNIIAKIAINAQGDVAELEFIKRSDFAAFDKFIGDWIGKWKYIPRADESGAEVGYTIVSIQYDLEKGIVHAPPPLKHPIQLPESAVISQLKPRKTSPESADFKSILPEAPLKISSIPPNIQALDIRTTTNIYGLINQGGSIEDLRFDSKLTSEAVRLWITAYLQSTHWKISIANSQEKSWILIPILLDTKLCKCEFGGAELLAEGFFDSIEFRK
jgi:hypothetical protein